jgi:hypothetical protein
MAHLEASGTGCENLIIDRKVVHEHLADCPGLDQPHRDPDK